jgi:DNA-binding response OmpR family regulator
MPEIDGVSATRLWRKHEPLAARPRVPIVALTANAFVDDKQQCLAAGMDDFIAKPVDPDRLFGAVLKLLDRGEQAITTSGTAGPAAPWPAQAERSALPGSSERSEPSETSERSEPSQPH